MTAAMVAATREATASLATETPTAVEVLVGTAVPREAMVAAATAMGALAGAALEEAAAADSAPTMKADTEVVPSEQEEGTRPTGVPDPTVAGEAEEVGTGVNNHPTNPICQGSISTIMASSPDLVS